MFEVSLDFHDGAIPHSRRFTSYSEVTQYLERVPNMLGFLSNSKVTIEVKTASKDEPTLFDQPLNA